MAVEDYLVRSFVESSCQTIITQFDFFKSIVEKGTFNSCYQHFSGNRRCKTTGLHSVMFLLHSVVPFA